jgi:hypothetical protein
MKISNEVQQDQHLRPKPPIAIVSDLLSFLRRTTPYGVAIPATDLAAPRFHVSEYAWELMCWNGAEVMDLCYTVRRKKLYIGITSGTVWIEGARGAALQFQTGIYFTILKGSGKLLMIDRQSDGSLSLYWPVIHRSAGRARWERVTS